MRVLMLGWEFPPYLSGGLGTACLGLTRALSRAGVGVTFVLPRTEPAPNTSGELYFVPAEPRGPDREPEPDSRNSAVAGVDAPAQSHELITDMESAVGSRILSPSPMSEESIARPPTFRVRTVDAGGMSPYSRPSSTRIEPPNLQRIIGSAPQNQGAIGIRSDRRELQAHRPYGASTPAFHATQASLPPPATWSLVGSGGVASSSGAELGAGAGTTGVYDGDLFSRAHAYADRCVQIAREEEFDVIHAHDWLAFPAGLAVAAATGKPLVVHVHSTEFDRTGGHINRHIYEIERRGMHGAIRVIAVSQFTANVLIQHYAMDPTKIDVVHNGLEMPVAVEDSARIRKTDRVVLFLGRITLQKGPAYFIDAAEKVLLADPKVKFLIAGDGDQMIPIIEQAAARGLGGRVFFTGFLRGDDVAKAFKMADVFVMPSVSEPFGLAALEAAGRGVPVIVSKKSGVSEVLKSVIQVDAWDTDDIAARILSVLRKPKLRKKMIEGGLSEARATTWDNAATLCVDSYRSAIAAMP